MRTGSPILSRKLPKEEILRRKRLALASTTNNQNCSIGPGLSTESGEVVILLQNVEQGRIIERPGKGVFAVTVDYASTLANHKSCRSTTIQQ